MTSTIPPLKVSQDYIRWSLATNRAIMGHLYLFVSSTGVLDYFTDLDLPITYGGNFYKSHSLRFEGLQRKLSVGVAVDEQTLKIWAAPTDTLFGANFLANAENGLLDGAQIVRYRVIWPFNSGNVAEDVQQSPLAVYPLFTGYTSNINKGGVSHVEMKVKSPLVRLNVNMPRNYFQAGCLWTLFGAGCTLIKASFAVNGQVAAAGATSLSIPVNGGIATPIGADGIANYAKGRLLFTTGALSGLQVLINTNDAVSLSLAYPLTALSAVADHFTYYPGCSKSFNTCDVKYSNKGNYRGYDKVPPIVVSA